MDVPTFQVCMCRLIVWERAPAMQLTSIMPCTQAAESDVTHSGSRDLARLQEPYLQQQQQLPAAFRYGARAHIRLYSTSQMYRYTLDSLNATGAALLHAAGLNNGMTTFGGTATERK